MVSIRYNIYSPGRTRPIPRSQVNWGNSGAVHWRNLKIHVATEMRRQLYGPQYQMSPLERFRMMDRERQGREAKAAFLTPNPP